MDKKLESVLETGDPRQVAAVLFDLPYIQWGRRGDDKRAYNYAVKKQAEITASPESQKLLDEIEAFCVKIRKTGYSYDALKQLEEMRDAWQKKFGFFDQYRWRMAKQLEIKTFLKRNRNKLLTLRPKTTNIFLP